MAADFKAGDRVEIKALIGVVEYINESDEPPSLDVRFNSQVSPAGLGTVEYVPASLCTLVAYKAGDVVRTPSGYAALPTGALVRATSDDTAGRGWSSLMRTPEGWVTETGVTFSADAFSDPRVIAYMPESAA